MTKRLRISEGVIPGIEFLKSIPTINEGSPRQSAQQFSVDFMKRRKVTIVATPENKKLNKSNRKNPMFNHLDPQ